MHINEIVLPSDRRFGFVMGTAFALLAWLFARSLADPGLISLVLLGVALAFGGLAWAAPVCLRPLNRAWMRFGLLLGRVMNPIVLTLLFVLVFVPTGLAMRLVRRDTLRLRRPPERESFWMDRPSPGPEPATAVRQF